MNRIFINSFSMLFLFASFGRSFIYQPDSSNNEFKIEMEWMAFDDSWALEKVNSGYTGDGYLRAVSLDSMKSPRDGFIEIHFEIKQSMEYFFHIWCRHDNPRNDIEVG